MQLINFDSIAAKNGHTEIVEVLLKNNADINAKNSGECTALILGKIKKKGSFAKFNNFFYKNVRFKLLGKDIKILLKFYCIIMLI